MGTPFVGSEAVAAGAVTPYQLRTQFSAIYPDVYVAGGVVLPATTRAHAAWLWSRRRGVVAGQSAAALHGARWVNAKRPAELIYDNRHVPPLIRTWRDRFEDDELGLMNGVTATNPARTALDIASRYPTGPAVAAIDALARATSLKTAEVELLAQRYAGRRGIRKARIALSMVDAGAESPRETWLRLILVRAGFPAPRTQIPVYDNYGQLIAELDMGWEHIKLAVEYDGDQHWTSRRQFTRDITRSECLNDLGWTAVRVTAEDTEGGVIARVSTAWERRV
ncbi:DUF559 domain-containing protein [Candidatus Mycobacterium wuenschmannii]|uniref:DUF559 domain-containing protein n=1 Tax=Candidatus Mycobacterium wuenschmannii TaxID=3027808 RepID=A0ABY8W5S0_9MYCO|nr:DUF559 domain-containing protein [Candidatus Mycobacterium wuenschmannii]WIM89797.1 DUF559 domain-containing protein [Candidatus Mycobacterium wuenschmannii]